MIQPIAFEAQVGSTIRLHVNGFSEGYQRLCWYRKDKEEHTEIKELSSPDYTVEYLQEGDYIFYTLDADDVPSETMSVYLHEDYASDVVSMIQKYLDGSADTEYNRKFITNLSNKIFKQQTESALFCLADLYRKLSDPEPFEVTPYTELAPYLERQENRLIQSMNRDGITGITLSEDPIPILSVSPDITSASIFEVEDGKERFVRKVSFLGRDVAPIELKQRRSYLVRVYAMDDLITVFHHFQLDAKALLPIWEDVKAKRNAKSDILEDSDVAGAAATIAFDEEERNMYSEEAGISSSTPVFPRVELTNQIDGDISVHTPFIDILNTFKNRIYLSGKDTDFLEDDDFSTSSTLDEEYTTINPRFTDSSKEQLFCLVSKSGKVLNRCERYSEKKDLDEYKEHRRLYELDLCEKQLAPVCNNIYTEAASYLKNLISSAKEDADIEADNLLDYLICGIYNSTLPYGKNDIIYRILRNHFVHKNYDSAFFESGKVTVHQGIRRFSFQPQKRDYVLVVEHVPMSADEVQYASYGSYNGAIDINMNDPGIYFVYAIAEDDFRFSGFAMMDTAEDYWKSWNLEMDVR